MKIENKTLEILDLVREKVLSPDEALPHILRLISVVERREQLVCVSCGVDPEIKTEIICSNCVGDYKNEAN